ncbi:MAG: hypothetical protein KDA58_02520 [Planctomycetaceae bacterium]|nr:hypothetical protein [Planctomycetaceae bacterium]
MTVRTAIVLLRNDSAQLLIPGAESRLRGDVVEMSGAPDQTLHEALTRLTDRSGNFDLLVELPQEATLWQDVPLHVAGAREQVASLELQLARIAAEHPGCDVRWNIGEFGSVPHAQFAIVRQELLQSIRAIADDHGLPIQGIVPFATGALSQWRSRDGRLHVSPAAARWGLLCADGARTVLLLAIEGMRLNVAVIAESLWEQSTGAAGNEVQPRAATWRSIQHRIRRYQLAQDQSVGELLLLAPMELSEESRTRLAIQLRSDFDVPARIVSPREMGTAGWDRSCSALGAALAETVGGERSFDFARPQEIMRPRSWFYWLMPVAALLLVAGGVWGMFTARQDSAERSQLLADIEQLQEELKQSAHLQSLDEYLNTQWDTPEWLPAVGTLLQTQPTDGTQLSKAEVVLSSNGDQTVRVLGETTNVDAVLQWNAELLKRRAGFELVPHAVNPATAGGVKPQFVIELDIPREGHTHNVEGAGS